MPTRLSRAVVHLGAFLIPTLTALSGAAVPDAGRSRPNIIFILADDLGWTETPAAPVPLLRFALLR